MVCRNDSATVHICSSGPPGTGTGGSGGRGPCLQLESRGCVVRHGQRQVSSLQGLSTAQPGGQTAPDSERDDAVGPGSAVIGYPACPPQPEPHPRRAAPCLWDVALKATPHVCSVAQPLPSIFLGSRPLPHPQHLSCTPTLMAPAQQVPLHPSPPSAPQSPGPGTQQVLIRCINKWVD